MSPKRSNSFAGDRMGAALNPVGPALDHLIDLRSERPVLRRDAMSRQRYREHLARPCLTCSATKPS